MEQYQDFWVNAIKEQYKAARHRQRQLMKFTVFYALVMVVVYVADSVVGIDLISGKLLLFMILLTELGFFLSVKENVYMNLHFKQARRLTKECVEHLKKMEPEWGTASLDFSVNLEEIKGMEGKFFLFPYRFFGNKHMQYLIPWFYLLNFVIIVL